MSRSGVCTYVGCLHWRLDAPYMVCFTLWTHYYRATSIRTIQTPLKGQRRNYVKSRRSHKSSLPRTAMSCTNSTAEYGSLIHLTMRPPLELAIAWYKLRICVTSNVKLLLSNRYSISLIHSMVRISSCPSNFVDMCTIHSLIFIQSSTCCDNNHLRSQQRAIQSGRTATFSAAKRPNHLSRCRRERFVCSVQGAEKLA